MEEEDAHSISKQLEGKADRSKFIQILILLRMWVVVGEGSSKR